MAKRNTTGMPKKKKSVDVPDAGAAGGNLVSQLQNSVRDEKSLQRVIIVGTGVVLSVLVVLILGALLWQYAVVPQQAAATVNGETITIAEFQDRVRLERAVLNQRLNLDFGLFVQLGQDPNQLIQQDPYGTWFQELTGQPELLGNRVLNDMIDERIVREAAAERGVEVDPSEVNQQVEQFFNFNRPDDEAEAAADADPTATNVPTETPTPFVSPTPTSTPRPTNTPEATPTPLPEEEATDEADGPTAVPTSTPRPTGTPEPTRTFDEREEQFNDRVESFYRSASNRANLSEEMVRSYFEYEALLAALSDDVAADVGPETTYVNARHILVESEEAAQNILTALEDGESFAALARAASTDTGSGAQGGDLGWSPATNYVEGFREAVLDAPIGEIVGPVESQFGFHIIQVREREEREMTENELDRAQSVAFNEWLEEITSDENNDITRSERWPRHVPLSPEFVYEPVGVSTVEPEGTS